MITDHIKIETFLVVVREKSFSKAAVKLGITQPAVTQQMNQIEEYLNLQLVNRKRNGITLTKEGEQFLQIAKKYEKNMFSISKDIINLSNQEKMLNIGTSYVIGNYILPCYLNDIKKNLSVNINLVVEDSNTILSQLLNDEIDVALLEIVENNEEVIVKKWMEDEIVLFSNQKLPPKPTPEDLLSFKWICRNPNSLARKLFKANLDRINYPDCSSFNIINESSSITSILQQIKTAPKDETPYVSIVSKHVICQEQPHLLFSTRLPNTKMKKSLYFVCKKDKKHDVLINSIEKYLFQVVKPSYFSRHPEEN